MPRTLLMAALLLLAGTGCSLLPWHEAADNVENAKALRIGQTKEEVLAIMGEPLSDEQYCTPNCWFYYVEPVWCDGLTTEDECIPLVFENGRLVGFGRRFYTEYRLRARNNASEVLPGETAPTKQ